MKCPRCGSELAANDQFCGECGRPRPAPAAARPAQPTPLHRSRRSWRWPVILGGTLLAAFAAMLIGVRWLLPPSQLGLSRDRQAALSATLAPTLAPPRAQTPAPTATTRPATVTPNPTAEINPGYTPVPANGQIRFENAVYFTLPDAWSYKTVVGSLWLKPPATISERALLIVDSFTPISGSSSAANELREWLAIHDDITWTPFTTETTSVGEMVWSTGESTTVMPIYAAIQGPLENGKVLHWWGQAPDRQWATMLPLFKQVSRSTTAAQP